MRGHTQYSNYDYFLERPHTPTKSAFTVPFHRDGDFVVNQQLLDLVTEKLSASGSLIALVGCGGVGYVNEIEVSIDSERVLI